MCVLHQQLRCQLYLVQQILDLHNSATVRFTVPATVYHLAVQHLVLTQMVMRILQQLLTAVIKLWFRQARHLLLQTLELPQVQV